MAENLLNTEYLRSEIKRQFGTQSAFARHLGWSRQYLSQVLNGKVNVTIAQLTLLSNALGMPMSSTFDGAKPRVLREGTTSYSVVLAADPHTESNPIVVATQSLPGTAAIEIPSLRRWTTVDRVGTHPGTPQERLELILSLQEKYRNLLPSSEMIQQYKQEEKQLEERQNGIRA